VELLSRLGLEFLAVPADIDEAYLDGETPAVHTIRLASEKAATVARDYPDALVIGSDTIVVLDQEVLGKPRNEADALRMLSALSGRTHEVLTGVAVVSRGELFPAVERVSVRFRAVDREFCEQYISTGEPMDKAGAYGIQGLGSVLVESISGDYFAVMGLPVVRTLALLERAGWRYNFAGLTALPEVPCS
jgi:septum formation protein